MSDRRAVPGLETRYSLLAGVPAIYHGDQFFRGLVDGLDAVLAPTHATVDDLSAYLDPSLCPPDFLGWLGGWMGLVVNTRWPIQRRRVFVARAVEVFRWRGTRLGIEGAVELYTGAVPLIDENGGTWTSDYTDDPVPGDPVPRLHVTVRTSDRSVEEALVDRIVADVKPAHVPHTVSVEYR
jgi:phage tail-like protein